MKGAMAVKRTPGMVRLAVGFSAGFLAGIFVRMSVRIISCRPHAVGGETLVFPLIILLIYFGYSMGKEISAQKAFEAGYNKGRSIAGGGGDDE